MKALDAEAIAGAHIEQARAAAARGEDLQTLALAHLRASMTLLALVSPVGAQALTQAVTMAGEMLGRVAAEARARPPA